MTMVQKRMTAQSTGPGPRQPGLVLVWYGAVDTSAHPSLGEPQVPCLLSEGVELNYLCHSMASQFILSGLEFTVLSLEPTLN